MSKRNESHFAWFRGVVRRLTVAVASGEIPVKDAIRIIEILIDVLEEVTGEDETPK